MGARHDRPDRGQLPLNGAVVWATNLIVFGLLLGSSAAAGPCPHEPAERLAQLLRGVLVVFQGADIGK